VPETWGLDSRFFLSPSCAQDQDAQVSLYPRNLVNLKS
jgi:hypothetical protein